MLNIVSGISGSGKSTFLKAKALSLFKEGRKFVFLSTLEETKNIFSEEILESVKIINANSFSQIVKLKRIEFDEPILINIKPSTLETFKGNTLKYIFDSIMVNEEFNDTDIFIDDIFMHENTFVGLSERFSRSTFRFYIGIQGSQTLNRYAYDNLIICEGRGKIISEDRELIMTIEHDL